MTRSLTRVAPWAAAAVLLLFLLVSSVSVGLNGDVQFVLGGLNARAGATGNAWVDTFVHRPVLYRLGMWVIDGLASPLRTVGQVPYEAFVRFIGLTFAATAGGTIAWAMKRRVGSLEAVAIGGAIGLALAFSTPWDYLQAEWFGAGLAAVAVAVTLGTARVRTGAFVGGGLAVIAAGMKITTLPYLVIALLLVAAFDFQRARAMLGMVLIWGLAFGLLILAVPRETRWLIEMSKLNPYTLLHRGFLSSDVGIWVRALTGHAALTPSIALVPAAIAGICLDVRSLPRAIGLACVLAGCGVLAISPMIVQDTGYQYHLAALPILASAYIAVALLSPRARGRAPVVLLVCLPIVAIAAVFVSSADAAWRSTHQMAILIGLVVAMIFTTIAVLLEATVVLRWRPRPNAPLLVLLALLMALAPFGPTAAWSLDPSPPSRTNASWEASSRENWQVLTALSEEIGRNSQVLYLASGSFVYDMGNPTDCRYPSPTFLRAAVLWARVETFESYAENARCISATKARYVVIQPDWIKLEALPGAPGGGHPAAFPVIKLPAAYQASLNEKFDCSLGRTAAGLLVCPARGVTAPWGRTSPSAR